MIDKKEAELSQIVREIQDSFLKLEKTATTDKLKRYAGQLLNQLTDELETMLGRI